jgi:hypothetical protein
MPMHMASASLDVAHPGLPGVGWLTVLRLGFPEGNVYGGSQELFISKASHNSRCTSVRGGCGNDAGGQLSRIVRNAKP